MQIPKQFEKRPRYKIGDVVVYSRLNDDNDMIKVTQSKVTESWGLLDGSNKRDYLEWYYHTSETLQFEDDCLSEEEILYKL